MVNNEIRSIFYSTFSCLGRSGRKQNKSSGKVKVCLKETKTTMELDFLVEEELSNLHITGLSFWYRNMGHLEIMQMVVVGRWRQQTALVLLSSFISDSKGTWHPPFFTYIKWKGTSWWQRTASVGRVCKKLEGGGVGDLIQCGAFLQWNAVSTM